MRLPYILYGLLAQMVEHLTFNQVVPRSNRGQLTKEYLKRYSFIWPLGQAVKTSPFHGGDMGSIPVGVTNLNMVKIKYAAVAQLVEQLTCNQQVVSSNLTSGSNLKSSKSIISIERVRFARFLVFNDKNYQGSRGQVEKDLERQRFQPF